MRSTISFLALVGSAAATGWKDSQSYKCPSNTNNQCSADQSGGYDFGGLAAGSFSSYGGMVWGGWTCNAGSKRFQPRTGGRSISGSCGHDKSSSPSFGCGSDTPDFSVSTYHVQPEFDCDLEFHYDMPDGSTCKHRNACSKSGTTITNSQCGGAKNVTIVYPSGQPSQSKSTCSVTVSTISFDCSTASNTVPVRTTSKATTAVVHTTAPTTQPTAPTVSSASVSKATSPAETEKPKTETTKDGASSSSQIPYGNSTVVASSTPAATVEVPPVTTTYTTSFDSTSTIFITSVNTVTSCAPTISNCPAESSTHVTEVTVTVAVSTTICPVTETHTSVVGSYGGGEAPPATGTAVVASSSASAVASASSPGETLPCPGVVPSCLNTFIWMTGCADNSDASCFCMEAMFINSVYDCMYAHGGSDAEVSQAVAYLMGLCGGFAGSNPAIATGATVTSYLTVTATAVASAYTTLTVQATTVEPWTDSAGAVVPGSSSTVVVSTAITVPQVGLTTDSAGFVGVVPATSVSIAAAATGASSGSGSGSGVAYTTAAAGSSAGAVGTIGTIGTIGATGVSPSTTGIVFGGAGRTSAAGFGAALAVMGLVAAM